MDHGFKEIEFEHHEDAFIRFSAFLVDIILFLAFFADIILGLRITFFKRLPSYILMQNNPHPSKKKYIVTNLQLPLQIKIF